MNLRSSAARVKLLGKLSDALRQLYVHDKDADSDLGSPDPSMTGAVRMLAYCMTFVRSAIAHGIINADFEEVVRIARAHEAEGWKEHRALCEKCGGH